MLNSLLSRTNKKNSVEPLDSTNIPNHVAIIMDGNGRWAKSHGMPRSMGHRKGAETLKTIVKAAKNFGIKALTVYGFSTENWKRPKSEVALLMDLIKEYLLHNVRDMHKNNVRIRFIGHIPELSVELQGIIKDAEELTKDNDGLTLHLAINYGGRAEITKACREITQDVLAGKITAEHIDEALIGNHLYTPDFLDVDLLIRPSGDCRISNFLLWQLAYAEFWFTDKNWPDFTGELLEEAIRAFQKRERRFGGLKNEE